MPSSACRVQPKASLEQRLVRPVRRVRGIAIRRLIELDYYGPYFWDYRFTYTQTLLRSESFFHSQRSVIGHILGGWRMAPIFTALSGAPLYVGILNSNESFEETQNSGTNDGAVLASTWTGGTTGQVQRDYPDQRFRRENDREFGRIRDYIESNPVQAGLVDAVEKFRWSSAWEIEPPERRLQPELAAPL